MAQRWIHGPPLVWARPLDALDEAWAALPPRARWLARVLLTVALVVVVALQLRAAHLRWGGPPVEVLVAAEPAAAGTVPLARGQPYPPSALPDDALTGTLPPGTLTVGVVEGTVLTRRHFDARGPAAALAPHERLVPVPVDPGWAVEAGSRVDVWVLATSGDDGRLLAAGRPVLSVGGSTSRPVALVALAAEDVRAATTALATSQVVLTHSPG